MTLSARIADHGASRAAAAAVLDDDGTHTYGDLERRSRLIASGLLNGRGDLAETRVAMLIEPGAEFAAVLIAIFRAGGIAVPLALSHPAAELTHVLQDSGAAVVIAAPHLRDRLPPWPERNDAPMVCAAADLEARGDATDALPAIAANRRALIVYTSGTTGKPKGVVTTHANIAAQITALIEAWAWRADDRVLLVLPLHHVHGLINVVGCALWAGAACEMPTHPDAAHTWRRLMSGDITVFTAVPTIYHRLIAAWDAADPAMQRAATAGCARLRLMMSGSAALPIGMLERWRQISGHVLLERYGMTEIGMALSNPLEGERQPGSVGVPLPSVAVRLVGEDGAPVDPGVPGELEVRGPGVFLEYWQRPDATHDAFRDGWFRTGDVAIVEDGRYRLLGRANTDILKIGGFKVSALEIEDTLRGHPAISECAVIGVPDDEWGQRVCAIVELRAGRVLALDELIAWSRERLANYKLPRSLACVPTLPRNAMGKIVKPDLAALFR